MKWILYIPCPKQLGTHAVQGFGVDAVVPDEAAQDFAQGPVLVVAAVVKFVLQKIRRGFQ